jgi:hypothetical protein
MSSLTFGADLEAGAALAAALGAFVALASAATLVGMPWVNTGGAALAVVRALGSLVALVGGAGLVWFALRG